MIGKNLVIVSNLKPAKIRGVESNGMLLAAKSGKKLVLITTDDDIAPGADIS
jgi:methionyl-tRNA synthetase